MDGAPYRASLRAPRDIVVTYRPFGPFSALLFLLAILLPAYVFVAVPPAVSVRCRETVRFSEKAPTMFVCDETSTLPTLGLATTRRTELPQWQCIDQPCSETDEETLMAPEIRRAALEYKSTFVGTSTWWPFLASALAGLALLLVARRPFVWRLTFSVERGAFDAIHLSEHFRAKLVAIVDVAIEPRRLGRSAIVVVTDHPDRRQVLHVGWLTHQDHGFVARARRALAAVSGRT